jgi:hypothetical protein
MGGLLGRVQEAMRPPAPRRVALVGLSETGKSHFLSVLCGDGTEVLGTLHGPTQGLDRVLWRAGQRQVEFVEFGWTALARGIKGDVREGQLFDTIVWFIDEHDTLVDVYHGRSALLAFVETQDVPTGLCIVLNQGRPYVERRVISRGRWTDIPETHEDDARRLPHGGRAVAWSVLTEWADTVALSPHFTSGIYATELSYTDPASASLCLEWILDPVPLDGVESL